MNTVADKLVSVIMPTFNQAAFISRAISSLLSQDHTHWELIIINDGSTDHTSTVIDSWLNDPRIIYIEFEENKGLGAAVNAGLDLANGEFISYLPSDDLMYANHLTTGLEVLQSTPEASLGFSSIQHHYNRVAEGKPGDYYQLVQVMHRKTKARFTERKQLESDDLGKLFWDKLEGMHIHTGLLTCDWVDHHLQRHKIMQEPEGGINYFRQYYNVKEPLRFHTTKGHLMDEVTRYEPFRKMNYKRSSKALKILIVGELAYNPERILAFKERGHELFGLWMPKPYWFNYVGPMPFGHVTDLDPNNYEEEIARIKPDIIYGCLNWHAVPFIREVVTKCKDIPFCWHFKEGPFICIEKGIWSELIDLYRRAEGRIYSSEEMKIWFNEFLPVSGSDDLILDGDLPKRDWFMAERSPLLSEQTGGMHTVVPGRPIGLHPQDVKTLADQDIHLHFYGEFTHGQWKAWIEKTHTLAPGYLHIHSNINQENWVQEFSQYDAGWLHFFDSRNHGEIHRANWDDLNIPARMATLALAGLPMIQKDNAGHMVATQSLAEQLGVGIHIKKLDELGSVLHDRECMQALRDRVWSQRMKFTFDEHVDELISYFKAVIRNYSRQKYKAPTEKLHQ